jgi:hypothetical protein
MFKITEGKGFQMIFENGLTISVQMGVGNYCSRKNIMGYMEEMNKRCGETIIECNNAEIAIWDKDENWITEKFTEKGDGQVAGWLTVEEVFEIMKKVQEYKG